MYSTTTLLYISNNVSYAAYIFPRTSDRSAMRKWCTYSPQVVLLFVMCHTDSINIVTVWLHTFSLLLAKLTSNDFLLGTVYMWSIQLPATLVLVPVSKWGKCVSRIWRFPTLSKGAWELHSWEVTSSSQVSPLTQTQCLRDGPRKKTNMPERDWCKYYWENVCYGQGIDKQ